MDNYHREFCQPCEELNEKDKLEKNLATIREQIEAATPHRFRLTDVAHPQFNARAWERIQAWKLSAEKPWLGFVGPTGVCKTRMSWLFAAEWLVRKTTARRIQTFAFVSSFEISEQVMSQFNESGSDKGDARAYLDRLRRVDVLSIDDLGKGRLTPAPAAELFALLDHRYQHNLVTLWTSNSAPEVIAAGLGDDMAAPFAGRLNDASKIFLLK